MDTMTLKELRKARGLTQVQVAERMGTHQSHVSKIEKKPSVVYITTLRRYLSALGVSFSMEANFGDRRHVLASFKAD